MFQIKFLENSWFFQKKLLQSGEVLFREWEKDKNIYIIKSWEVSVTKKLIREKLQEKTLSVLGTGKIFWEGALSNDTLKQVNVRGNKKTELLFIDAHKDMQDFLSEYPAEWLEFLKNIIRITHKRLIRVDHQLTAIFEMNASILHMQDMNYKTIFQLIHTFQHIIWADYIIYVEKNDVMEHYYFIRYDTRKPQMLQDNVIVIDDTKKLHHILQEEGIDLKKYTIIEPLGSEKNHIGYFVIWREKFPFEENEDRIITSISNSLTAVMRQKKLINEERNKSFIKE